MVTIIYFFQSTIYVFYFELNFLNVMKGFAKILLFIFISYSFTLHTHISIFTKCKPQKFSVFIFNNLSNFIP